MTGEMNTLRNKRIDLLKGMQGNKLSHNDCVITLLLFHNDSMCFVCSLLWCLAANEDAAPLQLKEEKTDPADAEPNVPSFPPRSSVTDAPAVPGATPADASPTRSSSVPLMSVSIKQEPHSPVQVEAELDPAPAHSTTSDPQAASAGASFRNGNHVFLSVLSCPP